MNNTSRGIVVFPSIYKSSAEAQALVQLETDGPENTAFKGFDDWLNNLHQSFLRLRQQLKMGLQDFQERHQQEHMMDMDFQQL